MVSHQLEPLIVIRIAIVRDLAALPYKDPIANLFQVRQDLTEGQWAFANVEDRSIYSQHRLGRSAECFLILL